MALTKVIGAGLGTITSNVGLGATTIDSDIHIEKSSDLQIKLERTGAGTSTISVPSSGQLEINNTSNAAMTFSANNSEAMRIDNSNPNRLFVNTTTVRNAGLINIDFDTGTHGAFGINDTNSGNGGVFMGFLSGGTFRGSITNNNNSAVAFNTTSDYRIKENVEYDWDATTRLKQLKPVNFNFIADKDNTIDGFLAHETQEVVPQAVTGTKDETKTSKNVVLDKDENIIGIDKTEEDWKKGKQDGIYSNDTSWKASITQKHYQQIDHSKLVPLLTKSLQEALAEIDTLKTKVAALENA